MPDSHLPRNGMTVREMAAKAGVSRSSIVRWTSEPREVYMARVAERHAQIRRLRMQGLSYRAIAAEVGCTIGTVHNVLKESEKQAQAS